MRRREYALIAALLLGPARLGGAQQFQRVGTGLPGPVVWSEGVEVFDADGDGKLDLVFANGVGFSSAGGALAPTLLVNHTPAGGAITFADESAARLPAGFAQQGKAVAACDVDGDGDRDLVFANGFVRQPSLLVNDGTGHFSDGTAARLPVLALNSFGLGCGDVDGDGDLDLALADAGPSAFGGSGGKARLLINDGAGHFADSPRRLGAANKVGAQNAQMADVDGDFDLDLIVDGKSVGQQLYLNDGSGHFTLQAGLPGGSANTYATDWADLDADLDLDGVYLSITGLSEGTVRNGLVPGGSLAFSGSTATLAGQNGDDDNDLAFLDADDDGRLDVIVGSLGFSQEKLYRNAGTFAPGSFVFQPGGFTPLDDSTLDLAVGDFDGDGRYDVATAQGESGDFTNQVYRNTGPADSHPPFIARVEPTPPRVPLSRLQPAGLARRAAVQDATSKRGWNFVEARLDVEAVKDGAKQAFSAPMRPVGGGLQRGLLQPAPGPSGTVGLDVTFVVHASDPNGNASDSPPVTFRVCGAEAFGPAATNSTGGAARIAGLNDPSLAANDFVVRVSGLPPGVSGVLLYGVAKLVPPEPSGGGWRLVAGTFRGLGRMTADAGGVASLALDFTRKPLVLAHPGDTRVLQLLFDDPAASSWNGSDGLEVVFCD